MGLESLSPGAKRLILATLQDILKISLSPLCVWMVKQLQYALGTTFIVGEICLQASLRDVIVSLFILE